MQSISNLSWANFEMCNQDKRGAFESMCRMLFLKSYCPDGTILHSNPNNPGIEVEPVCAKDTEMRISFQAKYFNFKIDYGQIKDSAQKAIKYYSEQLDILYLYCNMDITTTRESYKEIVEILNAVNIKLVPICNQSIFDIIIDYPSLVLLYFEKHNLSSKWFKNQVEAAIEDLGQRYNGRFNIDTAIEHSLDLFIGQECAVNLINQRKLDSIKTLEHNKTTHYSFQIFIDRSIEVINALCDVTTNTLSECLGWSQHLKESLKNEESSIRRQIDELNCQLDKARGDENLFYKLQDEIRELKWIANIPSLLKFDEQEQLLIQKKVLILRGEAGTGKSQLFANVGKKIVNNGFSIVLLLGQTFLCSDPISKQIPAQLGLHLELDELLDIFEQIGERDERPTILLIDALNESVVPDIWKTKLPELIRKIEQRNYVRLAISIRSGYEPLILDEVIQSKIESKEVVNLVHSGFRDESVSAVQEFLNHYGIPFSPEYYLQQEMTNPLFLTLFCKAYDGKEFSISSLFNRMIQKADREAQIAIGLDGTSDLLIHFVGELAEKHLQTGSSSIAAEDIYHFDFWETYGLSSNKIKYLLALKRFGLLVSYMRDRREYYYLSYNLLDDFACAYKIITKFSNDKISLCKYLKDELLAVEDGKILKFSNQGIFVAICGLFAEKFHEECIGIIDELSDSFDKQILIEEYLRAYLWRSKEDIDKKFFIKYVNDYGVQPEIVWPIFIECATKSDHPLNAHFLHELLIKKSLAHRDYMWTIHINGMGDDSCRIKNLILYIEQGGELQGISKESIFLLLILCAWFLASSNRYLRDKTTKAIVEILKRNFEISYQLLVLFENVNDPYILQRLYGAIWGACVKRDTPRKEEYTVLVHHIISSFFDRDVVCPDILTRDYARLIVARYVYEFPYEQSSLALDLICPPYKSNIIPNVQKEEYYSKDTQYYGFNSIAMSMSFDYSECGPGLYGDFGRYVFQAAVSEFENVNLPNLYHYSMQFIRDELGYTDELFGEYDSFSRRQYHGRHDTKKIERIGKKYQWIAFYNVLARISDTSSLKSWYEESRPYAGPWDPCVRDFDPTLSENFLIPNQLPSFSTGNIDYLEEFLADEQPEETVKEWCRRQTPFFEYHKENLCISDDANTEWVCLYLHKEVQNKDDIWNHSALGPTYGSQRIWSITQAFLVQQTALKQLLETLDKTNLKDTQIPGASSTYQLYNREYGWAPGYHETFERTWEDVNVKTGRRTVKKCNGYLPKLYNLAAGDTIEDALAFEYQEWTQTEEEEQSVGKIAPAYSHFSWESEYDASQETAISFSVPCKEIMVGLQLNQREYDGYYFTQEGILAAFDGSLSGSPTGLLIRKDFLVRFLRENALSLLWLCNGEKQYFQGDRQQIWGEWMGVFFLNSDGVAGEFRPQ